MKPSLFAFVLLWIVPFALTQSSTPLPFVAVVTVFNSSTSTCAAASSVSSHSLTLSTSCLSLSSITGNATLTGSFLLSLSPEGQSFTVLGFASSSTCSALASSQNATVLLPSTCFSVNGIDMTLTAGLALVNASLKVVAYNSGTGTCSGAANPLHTATVSSGVCALSTSVFGPATGLAFGSVIVVMRKLTWDRFEFPTNDCSGAPAQVVYNGVAGNCFYSSRGGASDYAWSWTGTSGARTYTVLSTRFTSTNNTCSTGATAAAPITGMKNPACLTGSSLMGDSNGLGSVLLYAWEDLVTYTYKIYSSSTDCSGLQSGVGGGAAQGACLKLQISGIGPVDSSFALGFQTKYVTTSSKFTTSCFETTYQTKSSTIQNGACNTLLSMYNYSTGSIRPLLLGTTYLAQQFSASTGFLFASSTTCTGTFSKVKTTSGQCGALVSDTSLSWVNVASGATTTAGGTTTTTTTAQPTTTGATTTTAVPTTTTTTTAAPTTTTTTAAPTTTTTTTAAPTTTTTAAPTTTTTTTTAAPTTTTTTTAAPTTTTTTTAAPTTTTTTTAAPTTTTTTTAAPTTTTTTTAAPTTTTTAAPTTAAPTTTTTTTAAPTTTTTTTTTTSTTSSTTKPSMSSVVHLYWAFILLAIAALAML